MTDYPLVTVLCLCYNQEKFVEEAIRSVFTQSYPSIELIVLDDGSSDNSVKVISGFLKDKPSVLFLINETNQGYTKSLNKALSYATGEFIVDLAADDMLMPTRVEEGVSALIKAGTKFGVNFSDAEIIAEDGHFVGVHSEKYPHQSIPQGDVYKDIVRRYFICPPTILFRKSVIDHLGCYDDSLAFEDFDFLVRAARDFHFCYTPKPLIKRRLVDQSMSQKQFRRGDPQRVSTFRVCEKIEKMNKTIDEQEALKKRIRYEFLLSVKLGDFNLAVKFVCLYFRLSSPSTMLR
ncbi:MAG: glycosyltransferase [Cytophagales bacterium]|nr:glycosyltransferase [Cytophagales bacterium]MCA6378746.1 glycosyltransferase [Cytophagales bacterium]MCA6387789.1 glycosyltransferase [Cytophagales bacterium]MCA6390550.1 glycosyltransferase [Cytophagales bacterium]MCA6394090.1 glycosyltransferase [Cytophagales bacterium]